MSEFDVLAGLVVSIPARDEVVTGEEKKIRYINTRTGWPTNGQRCPFCHEFLRRTRQGSFACATPYCSPETEKLKLIKQIRKKVKMDVRIE